MNDKNSLQTVQGQKLGCWWCGRSHTGWRLCHSWMLLSKPLLQQKCFFQPVASGEEDLTSLGPCVPGMAGRGRSCSVASTGSPETTTRNRILSFGWFLNQMLQAFVILPATSLPHFSLQGSEGPISRGEASWRYSMTLQNTTTSPSPPAASSWVWPGPDDFVSVVKTPKFHGVISAVGQVTPPRDHLDPLTLHNDRLIMAVDCHPLLRENLQSSLREFGAPFLLNYNGIWALNFLS